MAGSIEKKGDNTYRLRFMFNGSRFSETIKLDNVSKNYKNDANLQIALADFINRVKKGNFQNTDYTFTEYTQIWLDNVAKPNFSPMVVNRYISYLNNRILPYLGSYKINEITPLVLTSFFNDLKQSETMYKNRENKRISKGTVIKIRKIISSILQNACEMEVINNNPCNKVKIRYDDMEEKEAINYYDKETYLKVLELLKEETLEHRCIIELALKTGFRRSEIFGLTWNDIDFEKKTISINKGRHFLSGKGMYTSKPKTKASNRTIIIPNSLISTLKKYKIVYEDNEYLFEGLSMDGITAWFKKWQIKNNIPVIKFHDLRHTHATLLLLQGVDLKTIQNRLGHSDISMTMNTYTHVLEELYKTASDKLDEIL